MRRNLALALSILGLASTGCPSGGGPPVGVTISGGEHAGLTLRLEVSATPDAIEVRSRVHNDRSEAARLVPDQCGRVTEVSLARTRFAPEGTVWDGSLQEVKEKVLGRQRFGQNPDRFHPRRVEGGHEPPPCDRPARPVELGPGDAIDERWELPRDAATALSQVGSDQATVRGEIVEAAGRREMEFLDIVATGEADGLRAGRNLRVETPAGRVLSVRADADAEPSLGQRFDRMLADERLRGWLEAQPQGSWRSADLLPTGDELRFKAITTGFERSVRATATADGTVLSVGFPGEEDATRVFERRPARLPPAVRVGAGDSRYRLTDDLSPGRLRLPSGRLVADSTLGGEPQSLDHRVAPGEYPVWVTLARFPGSSFEDVAVATVEVSDEPTVGWRRAGGIAVDGGTAAFASPEAAGALSRLLHDDDPAWWDFVDRASDSLTAHDHLATELAVPERSNYVIFSTGVGDGGYPVFVGVDAAGRPTRFVIDFLLLHFAWPE